MARETFEDQAKAVRRIIKSADKNDRKHLECAARNLDAFGAFRQKLLKAAETALTDEEQDEIAEGLAKLLHIPIPGS